MPGRAYGWRQDGTLDPVEAKILRGIVADVLDPKEPKSMRAVVRGLNDRGVTTATGRAWAQTPLKRILLHPRMIGYQQDSKGRVSKWRDDGREPLLDRAEWDQLRDALRSTPARAASAPKRTHEAWLTGTARCEACGGPMSAKVQDDRPRGYTCREMGRGHVHILAHVLEESVRAEILDRCAEHGRDLGSRIGYWSSRAGVEERVAQTRARQATLAREFAAGNITQAAFDAGTAAAEEQIAALEHKLGIAAIDFADTLRGEVLDGVEAPPWTVVDIAAKWAGMSNRKRLRFARVLIDRVVVHKARVGGKGHRCTIEWVDPFPLDEVAFILGGMTGALPVAS